MKDAPNPESGDRVSIIFPLALDIHLGKPLSLLTLVFLLLLFFLIEMWLIYNIVINIGFRYATR